MDVNSDTSTIPSVCRPWLFWHDSGTPHECDGAPFMEAWELNGPCSENSCVMIAKLASRRNVLNETTNLKERTNFWLELIPIPEDISCLAPLQHTGGQRITCRLVNSPSLFSVLRLLLLHWWTNVSICDFPLKQVRLVVLPSVSVFQTAFQKTASRLWDWYVWQWRR